MPRYERQVNGRHVDDECCGQEYDTYPESPIAMSTSPIGAEVAVSSIFYRAALVVMPFLHVVHCLLNPSPTTFMLQP
jgi:hypothetical protein